MPTLDTLETIRTRLAYLIETINTSEELGYVNVNKFKKPNNYIDRNIYISSIRESDSSPLTTIDDAYYTQPEDFIITIDLYWGTFKNTDDDWSAVESKNYLLYQAIKQSSFLLTGINPIDGEDDIETSVKFDGCETQQMQEFYIAPDTNYPRGHQFTMTLSKIGSYSRDDNYFPVLLSPPPPGTK